MKVTPTVTLVALLLGASFVSPTGASAQSARSDRQTRSDDIIYPPMAPGGYGRSRDGAGISPPGVRPSGVPSGAIGQIETTGPVASPSARFGAQPRYAGPRQMGGSWRHRYGSRFGQRYYSGLIFPEYDYGYDYDYGYAAPVVGSVVVPGNSLRWCAAHYRSYDPGSRTYLGYDGKRHPCPSR